MTDSEQLEARMLALNLAAPLYSNERYILQVARKYKAFLFGESDYTDYYVEKATTPVTEQIAILKEDNNQPKRLTPVKKSKSRKSK